MMKARRMGEITVEDHRVESGEAGLHLLVRNKRPADPDNAQPAKTVLFVHGATYASMLTFDYAVDGQSWMDAMADAGFDAWCVDLLGYGGSGRPAAMAEPADANPPIVDTGQAVADVGRVVDFILARRGLPRLSLIGYSWGTAITGGYAARHPDKVARLVLYGALWLKQTSAVASAGPPGAYRVVDAEAAAKRWVTGLSEEQISALAPPGRIAAWAAAAIATDPDAARFDPPRLRAPSGVVKDVRDYWLSGRPTYDPAAIRAPTMIVVGEWDQETTPEQGRAVFDRLENAADRRYVVIGRGTHTLLLENQRGALRDTVASFLREDWPGEPVRL